MCQPSSLTVEIKLGQGECPLKVGHLNLKSHLLDSRVWMETGSISSFLGQMSLALSLLPCNCLLTNYNGVSQLLHVLLSCSLLLDLYPPLPLLCSLFWIELLSVLKAVTMTWDLTCSLILNISWIDCFLLPSGLQVPLHSIFISFLFSLWFWGWNAKHHSW